MSYLVKKGKEQISYSECPKCGSTRILYKAGSLICTNCDYVLYAPTKRNKYRAVKTVAKDGIKRDSKFEASVADELLMRKQAGDILDYDSQYRVDMPMYNQHGEIVHTVRHKVDYRVHERDGTFTLLEAKGVETDDYKFRRMFLEKIWLPMHPDHEYEVRKQFTTKKRKK